MGAAVGTLVLIFGMFVMVYTAILGRPRRRTGTPLKARSFGWLRRYDLDEGRSQWAVVPLAALASATVSEAAGGAGLGLVGTLAFVCALAPRAKVPFEVIGAFGALALMVLAVLTPPCAGVSGVTHVVIMMVAAVLLGGAVLFGRVVAGRGVFPFLLLFGLLDVVRFVSAPLGVVLTPADGALRWLVSAGAVLVLGGLAGFAPRLVMPLIGIGVVTVELWAATTFPAVECGAASPGRVLALVTFFVVYLLMRGLLGRLGR